MNARPRNAVPHLLTLGNLLAGVAALAVLIAGGPLWQAALLVAVGLICDLFDGRAARRLGVEGPFGAQLDSLADVVTFGVVPAVVLHTWILHEAGTFGLLAAAALVAAAATRLARFTVGAGEHVEGPARFSGLAVTIPAAIILGVVAADLPIAPRAAALSSVVLAGLMVSTLPYRSLKDRSVLLIAGPALAVCGVVMAVTGSAITGVGIASALGGAAYAASAPVVRLSRAVRRG